MTDLAQPPDTGPPAEVATEAQAEEFARFLRWFDADWFPAHPEELIDRLWAVGAPSALVERVGALLAIPAAPLTSPGELWRAINHPDLQPSPPPQPR